VTGFDGCGRPIVACPDCGYLPVEIPWRQMESKARRALATHNGIQHNGRPVPEVLPRRDLGLVDWL
jgi:hypothetical protein